MAFPAIPLGVKAFFASKKFLIGAGVLALILAVGAGTYFYLDKSKDDAVEAAVEGANDKATVETFKTETIIRDRTVKIDIDMDALREQTIKDYENARSEIAAAPVEAREEPVPDLVIDTLNSLSRMHEARRENRVPDTEVPVG